MLEKKSGGSGASRPEQVERGQSSRRARIEISGMELQHTTFANRVC